MPLSGPEVVPGPAVVVRLPDDAENTNLLGLTPMEEPFFSSGDNSPVAWTGVVFEHSTVKSISLPAPAPATPILVLKGGVSPTSRSGQCWFRPLRSRLCAAMVGNPP